MGGMARSAKVWDEVPGAEGPTRKERKKEKRKEGKGATTNTDQIKSHNKNPDNNRMNY